MIICERVREILEIVNLMVIFYSGVNADANEQYSMVNLGKPFSTTLASFLHTFTQFTLVLV